MLQDPRRRPGRRFDLASVLALAVAAVTAIPRSSRAIAGWVDDLHVRVLGWVGDRPRWRRSGAWCWGAKRACSTPRRARGWAPGTLASPKV
ncbi:MAG: hypothetical protein HHJ14_02390 [Cellulomonas sp.]|nr:hypothetical protein [Cellulomonas sp.]